MLEDRKAIELAKQALMEKRTSLARQMSDCDEAHKMLDRMLDALIEKEKEAR